MCHSYEASISALVVGWTGCLMLMMTKSKINFRVGLFFMYVLSMQLIEAMMWKDQGCRGLNQTASKIGFIQNVGQPILAYLALLPFITKDNRMIATSAILIYIASLATYIWKNKTQMSLESFWCTKADEGGLQWNWSRNQDSWMWTIFVGSLALTMLSSKLSMYTTLATLGTLVASYTRYGSSKAVGSWWCFYAVILPYVQLITQ
jgi:hypothetical protein